MDLIEYRFDEVTINFDKKRIPLSGNQREKRKGQYRYYGAQGVIDYVDDFLFDGIYLLIAEDGENLKSKKQNIAQVVEGKFWVNNHAHIVQGNALCDTRYLCYLINNMDLSGYITGSAQPKLSQANLNAVTLLLPSITVQKKIVDCLYMLDKKITVNQHINDNLEQQLCAIFKEMFSEHIDSLTESKITLGDLVTSIDNRGKTPPLSLESTNYPIIDVRALSGMSRIIDYNNCTKYVSEEIYNNWFRNGHPKPYDILISTVGSLAEMKIYLGNIGCIAQNVVGFRSKGISSLYIYQYLNYIKDNLMSYNIGSVQPSIKITHIIKHPIYVPSEERLSTFDKISTAMTKEIYSNSKEIEKLNLLRDTLLPKLISGELDISNIHF